MSIFAVCVSVVSNHERMYVCVCPESCNLKV